VAQAGLSAVQEEYRKYRIRSETLLRQKDAEIEAMAARSPASIVDSVQPSSAARSEESVTRLAAVEAKLQAVQAQLVSVREENALLRRQLDDCQSSKAAVIAAGSAAPSPAFTAQVDDTASQELERLKGEYATYRRRAMEMLKEKEDQVRRLAVVVAVVVPLAETLCSHSCKGPRSRFAR
jgi:hypothetical protein